MRTLSVTFALALSMGLVACSSSSGGSGGAASRDRNLIAFEELQEFQALDLMEAIRRLRPRWLQPRSGTPAGQDFPTVIVNDSRFGDMNSLTRLRVSTVQEVRFMRPRDATTR